MCGTCGCSDGELRMEAAPTEGAAVETLRNDRTERPEVRRLELDLLGKNDSIAAHNRAHFRSHRVLALNLVSSPGAGKTTLLVETLNRLNGALPAAVIEGDQETAADADRIRATGVPALQINTGRGCHLDADMIDSAFKTLHFSDGILFIENVGNLVCPAGFDLGEAHKVVIASVTEGEDKPLKYPNMFAAASLMLVSKADLLPHLRFDVERLVENARRINPNLDVIVMSVEDGTGFPEWFEWLESARHQLVDDPVPQHTHG